MNVTAAGAPSEEVLDSAEQEPGPRSRSWLGVVVVTVAVIAGLLALPILQPDPIPQQIDSTANEPSATSRVDPSLVDASARRLYGDTGIGGVQSFSTAIKAANAVVREFCRSDIPSWAATLVTSSDSYDQATFLMTPANRAYGTFIVQVELTWTENRYAFAVVAGHVERCT